MSFGSWCTFPPERRRTSLWKQAKITRKQNEQRAIFKGNHEYGFTRLTRGAETGCKKIALSSRWCVGVFFFLGFTHLEKQSTLVIHSFARGGYLNSLSADTDDITAESCVT